MNIAYLSKLEHIGNGLFDLLNKYVYSKMEFTLTDVYKDKVYDEFYNFFHEHDLLDFKFTLDFEPENNRIIFTPVRTIDQLALFGMLSVVDND